MTHQLKNIADLLEELTPLANEIQKRQAKASDIGFNVFQLASDTYYRENFHSYILYNLLNPEYHDEGKLFLNLFIDCLNECGPVKIEKNDFQNPIVERESDRVDIRIRDKVSRKSILIENKINDACDQARQIPRYYKNEIKAGFEVTGVVYLTLLEGKLISKAEWNIEEINLISQKLIYLPAVSQRKSNLIDSWLVKCIAASKHEDIPATLRQYKNLINYLSTHSMQKELLEEFYRITQEQEKFNVVKQTRDLLSDLCLHRAEKIVTSFHSKVTKVFNTMNAFPYNKVYRAKFWDCSLRELKWIDIECFEDSTEIIFAAKDDYPDEDFQNFLVTHTKGHALKEINALSATLAFKYPSEEKNLYDYLTNLFVSLENLEQNEVQISK